MFTIYELVMMRISLAHGAHPQYFKGLLVQGSTPIMVKSITLQDTAHLIPGSLDAPGTLIGWTPRLEFNEVGWILQLVGGLEHGFYVPISCEFHPPNCYSLHHFSGG